MGLACGGGAEIVIVILLLHIPSYEVLEGLGGIDLESGATPTATRAVQVLYCSCERCKRCVAAAGLKNNLIRKLL